MQHSLVLWWVVLIVLAGIGAALGILCALTARYYERILNAGCAPDTGSLMRALHAALRARSASIIWVDDNGRADLMPLVAGLVLATMLMALYIRYGRGTVAGCLSGAVVVLLMLSCIDARVRLLPDALTQPLLWSGLAFAWLGAGIDMELSFAGVVTGYLLLAVPRGFWLGWRRQECVGAGDVKLLAALGAWVGPWAITHVLMLACMVGTLFTVLHQRSLRPSGSYPFGPFLALAGMANFVLPSGLQFVFYV